MAKKITFIILIFLILAAGWYFYNSRKTKRVAMPKSVPAVTSPDKNLPPLPPTVPAKKK